MATPSLSAISNRYRDAYLVARTVVGFGNGIKVAGLAVAALIAVSGLIAAERAGTAIALALGIFGFLGGAVIYVFGVLIAAQGQMQYAILDVAVNSSVALSTESKTELILGMAMGVPATAQAYPANDTGV